MTLLHASLHGKFSLNILSLLEFMCFFYGLIIILCFLYSFAFCSYNLKSLSWTVRSVTQYRVGSHAGWRCRISRSSEARRRRPKGKAPRGQWMDGRIDLGRRRHRRLSLTIAFPSDAMHAVSLRSIERSMDACPAGRLDRFWNINLQRRSIDAAYL